MGNAATQTGKRAAYPAYKPSCAPWLGDVPDHWEVRRLKYAASINDEALPETTDPDYKFTYVDIGNVDAAKGIVATETYRFEEAPSRARRVVRDGDTIVSTVRTYLRAIAPIRDADGSLIVSTGFAVVRPRKLNPGYLSYALRAPFFVETVVSRSTGVSYPAINAPEVGNIGVTLPPLDEQRAIAAFLDRETARIDALIEKKRRQIELLHEKRSALISHVVTKGLNPNAPMKDSQIDGMGGMPAHWTLKRLKFLAPQVSVGIVITPSKYYEETGVPCLRSLNVRPDELTENDLVFISPESNELLRKSKLHAGDVVAVRTGKPGTAAVVDDRFDGANCIDLIIIRKSGRFDSRFLCHVLNSEFAMAQYVAGTSGAIQGHFNIETASNMLIPVPPLDEQVRIRERLDLEVGKLKRLGSRIEESITRLREHRTALISAAVTGKIDVRGEVHQ